MLFEKRFGVASSSLRVQSPAFKLFEYSFTKIKKRAIREISALSQLID
jgi:hypothetical protein